MGLAIIVAMIGCYGVEVVVVAFRRIVVVVVDDMFRCDEVVVAAFGRDEIVLEVVLVVLLGCGVWCVVVVVTCE